MCASLGLAALCYALHVFSNVVHVGDIRPLLRVGVDAHIYQVPQLVKGEGRGGEGGWLEVRRGKQTVSVGVAGRKCGFIKRIKELVLNR